jgi:uncharacterized protein YbjT (DUF2867 family)
LTAHDSAHGNDADDDHGDAEPHVEDSNQSSRSLSRFLTFGSASTVVSGVTAVRVSPSSKERLMSVYVVAGATGRVGSVVARELLARERRTRVIVRNETSRTRWRFLGADAVVGSLDDRPFLTSALRGAAGFFALLPENVPPPMFHAPRDRMATTIATAVRESGVPRVVMLSAMAASIPDGNGPARSLYRLERLLEDADTILTRIRPCCFQENVTRYLAPSTAEGVYRSLLPADMGFPLVATQDVGRVAAAALADSPAVAEIVDVLGPSYSARQLTVALSSALRRLLNVVEVPSHAHVQTLADTGMVLERAEAVAELMASLVAGRITPCGHRHVVGTTPVDEVIAGILRTR